MRESEAIYLQLSATSYILHALNLNKCTPIKRKSLSLECVWFLIDWIRGKHRCREKSYSKRKCVHHSFAHLEFFTYTFRSTLDPYQPTFSMILIGKVLISIFRDCCFTIMAFNEVSERDIAFGHLNMFQPSHNSQWKMNVPIHSALLDDPVKKVYANRNPLWLSYGFSFLQRN